MHHIFPHKYSLKATNPCHDRSTSWHGCSLLIQPYCKGKKFHCGHHKVLSPLPLTSRESIQQLPVKIGMNTMKYHPESSSLLFFYSPDAACRQPQKIPNPRQTSPEISQSKVIFCAFIGSLLVGQICASIPPDSVSVLPGMLME